MRVFWTDDAQLDLSDIGYFIALDDPEAARAMVKRIVSATERLGSFPESGRPGIVQNTRELIVGPYRIVYMVDPDEGEILVVTVVHCARRWPRMD